MTEKQGGSDVRANTTRAEPAGDGLYELTGHKWFCSAPMCDVFLVLAQLPAGLTCFLVEPGPGFEIQRLKDKLGTRSLPSSEVEFRGVAARRLGEEGRGVATIIEMVTHTRLDCVIGSAAGMRRGVAEAVNHARGRSAFGALLADAAGDGQRARRPRDRVRGRHRDGAAARTRVRRGGQPAAPLRHRGAQVLGLQARHAARRGGARVPRRQRLRRGEPDAAAAARRAAQRHLGGLGERHEPRRAARAGARARGPARVPRRVRARPRRRRAARRPPRRAPGHARRARERGRAMARAPRGRGSRRRLPGLAARAQRPARGRRRVLRRPPRRVARPRVRDAPARGRRRARSCRAP